MYLKRVSSLILYRDPGRLSTTLRRDDEPETSTLLTLPNDLGRGSITLREENGPGPYLTHNTVPRASVWIHYDERT